ncbi:MAG TPA: TonB-dependent receptor [Firmicutes bacterium]|nr:TonB-dependent receptor [Bacillota bacterium]
MVNFLSARKGIFCSLRAIKSNLHLRALSLFCLLPLALLSLPAAAESPHPAPDAEEELIVVTATRLPLPEVKVPASVEVITSEVIEMAGARNLGEAIRLAPNVMAVSSGGPGSLISPRLQGASSAQVQVLVDGRSINNGLVPVDLSRIPLSDVERIEVVKGPVSSLYGANALGGVINIVTQRPKGRQNETSITLGGFGERRLAFSSSDVSNKGSYLLTGDFLETDGWRLNSDFSSQAVAGKLGWAVPGGEVGFRASYAKSGGGSPGGNGEYDSWATPTTRYSDETVNFDWSYRSVSPNGFIARAYHSGEVYDYRDPYDPGHHETTWQGVEARGTIRVGAHQLVTGGEYRRDAANSSHLSETRTSDNLALYAEDLYQSGPWSVTWGGRLDAHSAYGQVFSPRVGVVRSLGPDRNMWLSVAKAFRAPSFEDLYWKDGRGNPDLRPETAVAYQAGLRSGGLDLSVFHKDVRDNIAWSNSSGVWRVENLNSTRFDGYELTYRKELRAGVSVTVAYARLFAIDADHNQPLSYRPAYQGSMSLSAEMPGDWHGTIVLRAAGPQWAQVWDTATGTSRQVEAPGYTVLDLSAARAVSSQLSYQLCVKNALNAAYQENPGYPMPGATLTATVTYRF